MAQKLAWRSFAGAFCLLALTVSLSACSSEDELPVAVPRPTYTPDEGRDATDERLGQLSVALMRYVTRHNHQLPDLTDIETLKKDLAGYLNERPVGGVEIFEQAETAVKFVTNPAAAGKNIYARGDGNPIVLVYQANPSMNDTRPVIFGDGSYRRVGENEWPKILRRSTLALEKAMQSATAKPTPESTQEKGLAQ